MRKNAIPPHVGIKGRINEKFPPLDKINVRINRTMTPFIARAGGDGKRRVLLNNFNATVSYAQEPKKRCKAKHCYRAATQVFCWKMPQRLTFEVTIHAAPM